ncbi:hypothetical protein POSPLADRAFT_1058838 [Postia placenta MAD-698-R-SB12]|uniref:Uncharacterized protein n=1 Tax=Postia placenta MAD-698-R-SB12 TaxID=670580 RepID=A0A1X6MWS5_9APHY|nr:hypothetical protein POSPLADRAFT_1058838 [Postia placenta MAD-698-R-SB12]OSX60663.1 hypothetical protein POSPLADRAFT_1058838 [Postia placenta MAD-698-R-SB12]
MVDSYAYSSQRPSTLGHRLNVGAPYYFLHLPTSGLKLTFCDKPTSSEGYDNTVRLIEAFHRNKLRQKKAQRLNITSIILSEIAHVSDEPLEPHHMLLKLTIPTPTGLARAITAHVYYSGSLPDAMYDTAIVSWKEAVELAEHEIWATRQALILRKDVIGQYMFHRA